MIILDHFYSYFSFHIPVINRHSLTLVRHLFQSILSSIFAQIPLYFSNSLSSFVRKNINLLFLCLSASVTLNVLTYPLILGIIKTNGLLTLYKYPIKYLELLFVVTNFEITISLTLTSQIFIGFFPTKNFSFAIFVSQSSTLLYYEKDFVIFLAN